MTIQVGIVSQTPHALDTLSARRVTMLTIQLYPPHEPPTLGPTQWTELGRDGCSISRGHACVVISGRDDWPAWLMAFADIWNN